jgi:serine/threonine protein kinase
VCETPDVCVFREVDILRRVCHPNIVKLYDVFRTEDSLLLVMEYIRGAS